MKAEGSTASARAIAKCKSKVRYSAKGFADLVARRRESEDPKLKLRSYKCEVCGTWHLCKDRELMKVAVVDLPDRIPKGEINMQSYMPEKEAAKYLNVPLTGLQKLVKKKDQIIRHTEKPDGTYFYKGDLEAFNVKHHHSKRMSIHEAAKKVGKTYQTLWVAVRDGEMPKREVLGKMYLIQEDLDKWEADKRGTKKHGPLVVKSLLPAVPTVEPEPELATEETVEIEVSEESKEKKTPRTKRAEDGKKSTLKSIIIGLIEEENFELASELLELAKAKKK